VLDGLPRQQLGPTRPHQPRRVARAEGDHELTLKNWSFPPVWDRQFATKVADAKAK